MSYIITDLSLDVAKENRIKPLVTKQYDLNSRFLRVQLTNKDQPIAVTAENYVIINAARSDGKSKSFRGTVTEDGKVLVPITHWMMEVSDYVSCSISIIDGDSKRKLTTTSFEIYPETAEVTTELPEDEGYDILVSLINDCRQVRDECEDTIAEAIEAISNANTAAEDSNNAARIATEKADRSDKSADKADTAASNADTKAELAEAAAQNANEKASNAETAASEARQAKEEAEEAAQNANDSATAAQEAAELANEKAARADRSADEADASASNADANAKLAESAAQSANTAATNAQEKATAAETAAKKANDSATAAQEAAENANGAADEARTAAEQIDSKLDEKVDKEVGKGLSSNDFTDELKEKVEKNASLADILLISQLDGTKDTYEKLMRLWFWANGAKEATPEELTALCDKWYTITREPWHGWVSFYQPDVSAVSEGTRGGDNTGMICEPSTDTFKGRDDYAGNPLFACVDCNLIVDPKTLEPEITAIDGITDNFERYSPDHFVGVLQMSGYFGVVDYDDRYEEHYSSTENVPVKDIAPLDEAVRPTNNNVRPWVVHSKYFNHTVNNKLTSYAGVIPTAYSVSHNTLHTLGTATGTGYSGGTTADDAFLKIMLHIKYATLTGDGIIQGCCNCNKQSVAKVSETNVKRVVLSEADGAYFEPGMGVLIGTTDSNNDRGRAHVYSTTGQAGAVVTSVEKVSISETDYTAVYVNTDAVFDTTANTTLISTFHWANGTTDCVLGNDGSPKDNTSGKYPGKIQGIEFMQGAYEVFADVILKLYKEDDETYWYEPYVCRQTAKFATSITADYQASGIKLPQPASSNWYYIKRMGYKKGVYFPIDVTGASSSTYVRDAFFLLAATEGIRERLARCSLGDGVARAGVAGAGNGAYDVGRADWSIFARLSPNGNRGEWNGGKEKTL